MRLSLFLALDLTLFFKSWWPTGGRRDGDGQCRLGLFVGPFGVIVAWSPWRASL